MKNLINKFLGLFDKKLIKFIIVGVINTLVGTAIMFGLYNLILPRLGWFPEGVDTELNIFGKTIVLSDMNYWIASAANYILTSILSFFLNKYFTFKNKDSSPKVVLRFIVNIAVCYFLAYGIAKPLAIWLLSGASEKVQSNIAMIVGMCFFTGFNYLGQRLFAFKEPAEK